MAATKPKMDTERVTKRLLLKHSLRSIRITVTERSVRAEAMPQPYHKLVSDKRQEQLTNAAMAAGGSLNIAEAQRVNEEALAAPLSTGHGETIEDALLDLERALKAL